MLSIAALGTDLGTLARLRHHLAGHNLAVRPSPGGRPAHASWAVGSGTSPRFDSTWSDDDLVVLIPGQDPRAAAALEALYERYSNAVYGLGLRMFGDAGLAEDLLQEAFWRLWQHAGQYQPGRVRFGTWLLRVATNLAISEQRKASRRPRPAPQLRTDDGSPGADAASELADPQADVPDQVWMAEQRRAVVAALSGLPPEQRQAVELAYFDGLTHVEIAAFQGAPLSTVKTRLSLGLRKLASYLRAHSITHEEERS